MSRWDLIVIGAGAVGSAAGRAAAEAGARTLVLEQYEPAGTRGSSHGHSRIFRHAYFEHPDYVPLLRHSTARFESLERESGVALLHRCGMLVAGPGGSAVVAGSLESARRWDLEVEALDAEALARRWPCLSFPPGTIAAFEADAGLVRPEAAVHAALQVARHRGATLRSGVRVQALVEEDLGVRVETDSGTERAAGVVVAAGPWAAQLLPELAHWLRVTRQVQAWFEPTAGTDLATLPCWFHDRGPDQPALYGLAPDPLAAARSPSRWPKVALHGCEDLVDPETGARPADEQDLERIRAAGRDVAPRLLGRAVAAATCLYTMSPDGHFLVGTRPGRGRVHYAAGLSGHGFKLGPALGDALAALALEGRTSLPVDFLSPARLSA
jgi:sarcosine oxidase